MLRALVPYFLRFILPCCPSRLSFPNSSHFPFFTAIILSNVFLHTSTSPKTPSNSTTVSSHPNSQFFLFHPPTNPSPPCFSFLITIPIPFPGSGVRTGPCGPSAPPSCPLFSALLGFCPVCRLPLQFVFFKLHHPRFFASFLLPAFVNSSQRGRSLGLAFEASRIVLLIILGNNPSFSFLLERACTPPPRALRLSSQANKRKFCSVQRE